MNHEYLEAFIFKLIFKRYDQGHKFTGKKYESYSL